MGQRETAAPMFSGLFAQPRLPENTPNRRGSSAICQSELPRHRRRSWRTQTEGM
jgi:hypothetical protein